MKNEIMKKLEDILELDENTLTLETQLADLEDWDSLSRLSVAVMSKTQYNKLMETADLEKFKTVDDICTFICG